MVQYPIDVASGAVEALELETIQARLHALDHPIRLRILRSLLRGAQTTGELGDSWQLTAPEISRHLAVMRAAKLVTTQRRGRYVEYQLEVDPIGRLGTDLVEALLR
ncbi:ArsR/SmtB family transcription factor [Microlunatus soli]|uniref:ArsR/SmtB family transcription factor n=1 Tax=Microlunatus soli TaxID=630515 RepID=UPI000B8639E1|nr:metalloregulator ArsR/SmtB family transcription factor [Microlunatus soli]